jgi:outer membrane protein
MIAALAFILFATSASADPATSATPSPFKSESLYELGIGAGAAWFPHYPGSDQTRLFALPVPYFVYRGHILKSDRDEGTRAQFFRRENLELTLSAGGALPVSSSGNAAREGMPDLGWMGEIGPKLSYRIPTPDLNVLRLGLALRGVFASNGTAWSWPRHVGTNTELQVSYRRREFLIPRLEFLSRYSATFASEGVQSYFYEVAKSYEKPDRPQYSASAGYLYSTVGTGLGYETVDGLQKVYVGASYDFLDGAANVSSPLVRSRTNSTFLVGYVLVLRRSEARASDPGLD